MFCNFSLQLNLAKRRHLFLALKVILMKLKSNFNFSLVYSGKLRPGPAFVSRKIEGGGLVSLAF